MVATVFRVVTTEFGKGLLEARILLASGQRTDHELAHTVTHEGAYLLQTAHTLYVGDSEVDILTAANAGVDCLSVTWGFRTQEHLREAGATRFIHEPGELLAVLSELER